MIKDDLQDIYALPENLFNGEVDLTDKEFRVLVALYYLAEGRPKVKKTHEQISKLINGASSETLRTTTKSLQEKGMIKFQRTRRNHGKLYVNEYELLHPMRLVIAEGKPVNPKKATLRSGW